MRKMILKNYTTNKDHNRTLAEIEKTLAQLGAKKIMKEYDDNGNVESLSFQIFFNENMIAIKLPARVDRIPYALRRIYNNDKSITSNQKSLLKKAMGDENRTRNIGWRIIQDWLDSQIAVMQLDQINMIEALLPFTVVKNNKTLYELLESNDFSFNKMGNNLIEYNGS
jgi:hypothetical protein